VLAFGVLILTTPAYAESPREQLNQMVEQLQKNPADNALREKIIKLAQEIKPAPAVPEEARRHFIKATTLQNEAKNPDDYDLPIQEYRQALLLAPWWSDAYFNLSTAFELKQQYAEAIQNLKFSILASPEGPDARAAQDKIYALEAKQEKVSKQKNQGEEFLKKLGGAKFVRSTRANFKDGTWRDWRYLYEIRGNKAYFASVLNETTVPADHRLKGFIGVMHWDKDGYLITGREFVIPRDDQDCKDMQIRCVDEIQSISEDGNKITEHRSFPGYTMKEQIYLREK
jgi:tetratricopeptide (TPR) repeat protein